MLNLNKKVIEHEKECFENIATDIPHSQLPDFRPQNILIDNGFTKLLHLAPQVKFDFKVICVGKIDKYFNSLKTFFK